MLYVFLFFLWAVVGAQLFQYSAYLPQTWWAAKPFGWAKFALYTISGPIIWALWACDKMK